MRQPSNQRVSEKNAIDCSFDLAWQALLDASDTLHEKLDRKQTCCFRLERSGTLQRSVSENTHWSIAWQPNTGWITSSRLPTPIRDLFDLYLAACSASADYPSAIAHLGQSLDGHIATHAGDSYYVTGQENILHLHRMRALCDAVVVGAGTVAADDPQLTTRLVPGDNPVRVVLDPKGRLGGNCRVLSDGQAPTLLMCAEAHVRQSSLGSDFVQVIGIPERQGRLALDVVLSVLHRRGLYSIFVEGGGITVSNFLEAGLLNRVQIAVAPLIIGSGRTGLQTAPTRYLRDCLRPRHRVFRLGQDILFDCDLDAAYPLADASQLSMQAPLRII